MAGNIIRRGDNRFLVRVFLHRDPTTGRQKVHTKTIHGTKKEAQAYLNKVLRERDLGTWVEPTNMTVSEYLDRWLREADTAKQRTRTFNAWAIGKYVVPYIGSIKLSKLSGMEIKGLYYKLSGIGLASSTIRRINAILSVAFGQAVEWKLLSHNPAKGTKLAKDYGKKKQVFGPNEARRFLEQALMDRYSALWQLALETGMRPGEYLGLKWSDIDFTNGTILVHQSLVWHKNGQWELASPKTETSNRQIILSSEMLESLISHKQQQDSERKAASNDWEEYGLVFTTVRGTPIRAENLKKRHFKPILKAAGLEDMRLYDLRHSTATILIAAGVPLKVVSERLGHADVSLTLRTYVHVLPSMQAQATDTLRAALY